MCRFSIRELSAFLCAHVFSVCPSFIHSLPTQSRPLLRLCLDMKSLGLLEIQSQTKTKTWNRGSKVPQRVNVPAVCKPCDLSSTRHGGSSSLSLSYLCFSHTHIHTPIPYHYILLPFHTLHKIIVNLRIKQEAEASHSHFAWSTRNRRWGHTWAPKGQP